MIYEYATRRDKNGNRYYLGIDNETFIFSRERGSWYTRADIIEISKKDYHKILEQLQRAGYIPVKVITISPGKSEKHIDTFTFKF